MTYEESVMHAKDVAVEKGLYSKEYAEAVKQMNELWLTTKQNKVNKTTNKIAKILWHKIQKDC